MAALATLVWGFPRMSSAALLVAWAQLRNRDSMAMISLWAGERALAVLVEKVPRACRHGSGSMRTHVLLGSTLMLHTALSWVARGVHAEKAMGAGTLGLARMAAWGHHTHPRVTSIVNSKPGKGTV